MYRGGDLAGGRGEHLGDLPGRGQGSGEAGQGGFALRGQPFRGHVSRGADEEPAVPVRAGQAGRAACQPDRVPVAVPHRDRVPAPAVPPVFGEGPGHDRPPVGVGIGIRNPGVRPAERQAVRAVAHQRQERLIGLQDGSFLIGEEKAFLEGVDQRAAELRFAVPDPGQLHAGPRPGQQLGRGERLDQVVVGARPQALDGRLLAGPRRQQQHRHGRGARVAAQGGHQRQAVEAGHHHVADHQVGGGGADRVQGGLPVGDRGDLVADGAQQPGQVVPHVGVVVRDQHPYGQGVTRLCGEVCVTAERDLLQHGPHPRAATVLRDPGQPAQGFLDEGIDRGRCRRRVVGGDDSDGGQVGAAERQPDGERGALALGAGRGDAAAVQLDEFLDEGQADAAALVRAGARVLDAVKPLEQPGHLLLGDADSGVGDRDDRLTALGAHGDANGAVEGEFQRVAEQVQHHLLPHAAVEVDGLGQRGAVHLERQAGAVDSRPEDTGQLGGHRRDVGRFVARLHAPGFDAGEVQQRVDQPAQAQPVAADDLQLLAHLDIGAGQVALEFLHRPHDQGQRGAELVADVGEERGLGPVQLGELLRAALLVLVAAGAPDPRREVPGHEADERAVALVQRPVPVQAGHQEPVRGAALLG